MNGILVKHTGQTMKKIEKDTDRDMFMTSKQALNYGVIDQVISAREKNEEEGTFKKNK